MSEQISTTYVSPARGGPHGLGEPDDRSLRRVEKDVLIPKKVRERSRTEKCAAEVAAFGECCKETSILSVMKCQEQTKVMKSCLEKWFYDEGFVQECTEQYLQERSEYRKTGIPKKLREKITQPAT